MEGMDMNRKRLVMVVAGVAIVIAGVAGYSYHTLGQKNLAIAADMANYEDQCQRWVAKEFSDSHEAILSKSKIVEDQFVFDFFTPKRRGSTDGYSVLCVVDPKTGSMFRPGAFERSKWD